MEALQPPKRRHGFQPGISGNPGGRLPRDRVTPESLVRLADAIALDATLTPAQRLAAIMPLVRAGLGLVKPRRGTGGRARALARDAVAKAVNVSPPPTLPPAPHSGVQPDGATDDEREANEAPCHARGEP